MRVPYHHQWHAIQSASGAFHGASEIWLCGVARRRNQEDRQFIRVNANFDEQMGILKRLRDYTREKKTGLSLTFCFMVQNWREFGEFCLMADAMDCPVGINTVGRPIECSVNALPYDEMRRSSAEWRRRRPTSKAR